MHARFPKHTFLCLPTRYELCFLFFVPNSRVLSHLSRVRSERLLLTVAYEYDLGLVLLVEKFAFLTAGTPVAHCITFRLFVVNIILPWPN
jgi:hypothetical protein